MDTTSEPKIDRHKKAGMFIRLDDATLAALSRLRESTGLGIAAAITYAIRTVSPGENGRKKISRKSDK